MPSILEQDGNVPRGQNRRRLSGLLSRFVAVGLVATAVQYLVLVGLVRLAGVAAVPASAVGFVLSAGANYGLNYRFTFAAQTRHRNTGLRFVLVSGVGLLVNSLMMALLVDGFGIQYLLAQVIASAVVLAWNFVGSLAWTFRSEATILPVLVLVDMAGPVSAEVRPLNSVTVTAASGVTQTNRVPPFIRATNQDRLGSLLPRAPRRLLSPGGR